ncbi:PH domain-containing protein [Micromonospora aurantiaca (nom. illeg.)]|uniref:PH domain-containing protein n=1 Tax=Micromonospora aurantiaca (nom. illeg.) TaxID=47850 RepID=UPI003DA6895D
MRTPAVPGRDHPVRQVTARPRRIRQVSAAAALVVLAVGVYSGLTLSGTTSNGGRLFPADRWAVVGVGAMLAALTLLPWRLRVHADVNQVRVCNLLGDVVVPWNLVERVRFDRKAAWASLDLINGDAVPLLGVQVFDREEAVAAVRALRTLHSRAVEGEWSPPT